jgi:hypothetical protein
VTPPDGTESRTRRTVPSDRPGVYVLTATAGSSAKTVTVDIVGTLDLDPPNFIRPSPPGREEFWEENPGGWLVVNDDDSNGNGIPDLHDPIETTFSGGIPTDDRILPLFLVTAPLAQPVKLEWTGGDKVTLYQSIPGGAVLAIRSGTTVPSNSAFYIEAKKSSVAPRDIEITATLAGGITTVAATAGTVASAAAGGSDTIRLTAWKIDINADYNRDGTPEDHAKEADPVTFKGPKGAVILANMDDDDGDGEPDGEKVGDPPKYRIDGPRDVADIAKLHLGSVQE